MEQGGEEVGLPAVGREQPACRFTCRRHGRQGSREQGTGNREQGTGSREQGIGNREQGLGKKNFLICVIELHLPIREEGHQKNKNCGQQH